MHPSQNLSPTDKRGRANIEDRDTIGPRPNKSTRRNDLLYPVSEKDSNSVVLVPESNVSGVTDQNNVTTSSEPLSRESLAASNLAQLFEDLGSRYWPATTSATSPPTPLSQQGVKSNTPFSTSHYVDEPSNSAGIGTEPRRHSDNWPGKQSKNSFSQILTNEQVYTLIKLHESLRTDKSSFWPEITKSWNETYPDHPVNLTTLRNVYMRLNLGDRSSEMFKIAIDDGIPIPQLGASIGQTHHLKKEHTDFLTANYPVFKSMDALIERFVKTFPEMRGIGRNYISNKMNKDGLVLGERMGVYSDEQKLFLLRRLEADEATDMDHDQEQNDTRIKVVQEFREEFNEPGFTNKKLGRLLKRLNSQTSNQFEQKMIQNRHKRETKRHNSRQNHINALTENLSRAQMDLEILETFESAANGELLRDIAGRIRLSAACNEVSDRIEKMNRGEDDGPEEDELEPEDTNADDDDVPYFEDQAADDDNVNEEGSL